MNLISFLEEDKIAFLRVPKCLRRLVTPHAADLYALLRERRRWLIEKKLIKNHEAWFFYPTRQMQSDLLAPNSLNHLKLLLKKLEAQRLVQIQVQKVPPFTKYYRLDDSVYSLIAQREAKALTKRNEKEFEEEHKEEDYDPI
ncbi:MAG: hypothetical protein H7Y42_13895 [Chitinophagaceae bacterium]|nr:hypothetical protein [Chitinophagaceae bacterium]